MRWFNSILVEWFGGNKMSEVVACNIGEYKRHYSGLLPGMRSNKWNYEEKRDKGEAYA